MKKQLRQEQERAVYEDVLNLLNWRFVLALAVSFTSSFFPRWAVAITNAHPKFPSEIIVWLCVFVGASFSGAWAYWLAPLAVCQSSNCRR